MFKCKVPSNFISWEFLTEPTYGGNGEILALKYIFPEGLAANWIFHCALHPCMTDLFLSPCCSLVKEAVSNAIIQTL